MPDRRADLMPDWLSHRAQVFPNRLALIGAKERLSFLELNRRATQTARQLGSLGLRPNDRIALLLRNGLHFAVLAHAISRLGAILVPLNIRLAAAEICWQLTDVRASLLVHDRHTEQTAAAVARELPDLKLVAVAEASTGDEAVFSDLPEAEVSLRDSICLSDVHSIIYTSGTTGRPKGAMLTYGNHWWSAIGSALNLGIHSDDRWLACLPLFHIGGLAILLRGVIYGVTVIINESFDPTEVNRAIDEERATIVSVVSAMLRRILEARGERPYPPTLRCVLVGGGPVPNSLLEDCARLGLPIVQTYGLTEAASQVATLSLDDSMRKLGSAGKPLPVTELRIERDGVEAAAGEVGEIVVRSPTVMLGYVNRPDDTALALRGGWLHTGDLGYLDAEGYLYVLDRRDDLIISGGENIYPAEVEAVLLSHPAVEDAGVIGAPDERWGQVVAAAIKLREGAKLTEGELLTYCHQRLARYKAPAIIRFVHSLPRSPSGKLLRNQLPELLGIRKL